MRCPGCFRRVTDSLAFSGYQICPAVFSLDLELSTRLPGKPKAIFHQFYDAISKASRTPSKKFSLDYPLIDQTSWIILNWKSLGSCSQILVTDEFQNSVLTSTNCVVILAEGVAYISDIVRKTIRMFLQQKFFLNKPILFLFVNKMVECVPREFRAKVESSLEDLAKEVILGSNLPVSVVHTKACRATTGMEKDVTEGLEQLWISTGNLHLAPVLYDSYSQQTCGYDWTSTFLVPRKRYCRPSKAKRRLNPKRINSEELLTEINACPIDIPVRSLSLGEMALSAAAIENPELLSKQSAKAVLRLSLLRVTGDEQRRTLPHLHMVQSLLKNTIRKNHALQDYLYKVELETDRLLGESGSLLRVLQKELPNDVKHRLSHILLPPVLDNFARHKRL